MTITFHPNGTIESNGVSTVINKPAWMITGGANMYNNNESDYFDGEVFRPSGSVNGGNFVNLDTHSGYEVSSGRYVIQISGIYHIHACGTYGSSSSHFVYITVNGNKVGNALHLGYSSAHENFGISETYSLTAGDYLEFRRRGGGYTFYSLDWGGVLVR